MRISPPIAVCTLVAASLGVIALGRWYGGDCGLDPAGESHWLDGIKGTLGGEDCDPWRFVSGPKNIAKIEVLYLNGAWGHISRRLEISSNGRIALLRSIPEWSDNWEIDRDVRDPSLARHLLGTLAPLTNYNREEFVDGELLELDPTIQCNGTKYDGGTFMMVTADKLGRTWSSSVDENCDSTAIEAARKRIGDAFALAVKRTGAGEHPGEFFYARLN